MFRTKTSSTSWSNQRFYEKKGFCYHQIDASGHITDVNQAWLNLTGFSKEEVVGQSIHLFMTPFDPDEKNRYHWAIEDYTEMNGKRLCLRVQNQQTIDIILFSTSEYKTAQQVIKTHAWFATLDYFIQDKEHFNSFITEIKTFHGKMCEHTHYLADILNSLDDLVMAFNGQKLTSVNQPTLTFFGCKTLAGLLKKMPEKTLNKLNHWQKST